MMMYTDWKTVSEAINKYDDERTKQNSCVPHSVPNECEQCEHLPHYTLPPVETCTPSWKAIVVMAVPSSELATSLA